MARGKSSVAVFLAAFLLRLLQPFGGQITPLDELYHLKRIEYSAAHFPHVLDLDPDRGVHGAFCPWPPLYDLVLGGIARLFGVRAVFWVPPIGFALFAALATWWIARRFGSAAAWAAGAVLAASPFLVQISARGDIDHHWLEPPLVFAMLAAVCAALDKDDLRAGILLGIAITCAMFVQTALLVAAGLSFVVLFLLTDGIAGATAFSIAAAAVALYRLTRPPGYPDSAWFLGWTHAALFAAAAVACALPNLAQGHAAPAHVAPALSRRLRSRLFALLAASAVVLACPTAPSSLLAGSHFFGGDRWLRTIVEFQPLWQGHLDDYLSIGAGLGIGTLLVWPLLFAKRRQHLAVAIFAAVYLVLTLTSRRFWTVAIPLLALASAIYATHVAPALSRRFSKVLPALLLLAIALPPPIQLALWMRQPTYTVAPPLQPWVRMAQRLRALPPGRVLAAWSYGHMLDVIGGHPVIVDNFGTMPDESAFERAYDALLQNDEEALVRWCRAAGVRYVVLEYPAAGMHSAVAVLGVEATKRPRGTWWWRAWFARGSRHFRLVSSEPTVMLLELREMFDDVLPAERPFLAHWFAPEAEPPTHIRARWIWLRCLGVIFLSAFDSLWFQIHGLIGPNGLLPAGQYLQTLREVLGARGHWLAPTLLWLNAGNRALTALVVVGLLASITLIFNILPRTSIAVCFVCFLSFVAAARDFSGYQSDGMLLEAALLSLFLGRKDEPPTRAAVFMLQWEWFRIYFESGVVKILSGEEQWRNLTAMDKYYENGPLPTWLGWYVQQWPHSFHAFTAALTLIVELFVVWLLFLPKKARLVAFCITTPLQIGIILTANYAFLNYLVLFLGIFLLADPLPPGEGAAKRRVRVVQLIALPLLFITTIASFLFPSFPTVRLLEPFRVANSYGLFAVMTRARYEIEFQGTADGEHWVAYPFRYKPQDPKKRPGIYAPYQPRFDWNLWFASLGGWEENRWVLAVEARLLQNQGDVLELFAGNPFARKPPVAVRSVLWRYWFTTREERARTGAWWNRRLIGPYAPAAYNEGHGIEFR